MTRDARAPTGTVTFAFTDVEGSTERWERHRTAMQAALRRHDELVRAAIVGRGGRVFKTVGDAFCAAFDRPDDALVAMLDVQQAIAREDFSAVDGLRVRAALHTGTADERDGDYFGPTVNRVARLVAIGRGGQVLASRATAELVGPMLPDGVALRDLGEHRLADLARPERVFQVSAPGVVDVVAPLRSLDVRPNNLPRELTSFVGREAEIAEILALVRAHALVSLVGAGGIGKSRTALQVAARSGDAFPDGIWSVELAPLTNGDYVASTIAQAAGIALGAGSDPVAHVVRALATKRVLLVLDNCEHLVEAVASVVAALMRDAAGATILVSSRQALGVRGEEVFRLSPFALPQDAPRTAAEARTWPAIALFAERARAVDRRFELASENVEAVVDVCRRLDGIALAIELAAVRVKILRPGQLRDRLDERFRMLTGGSRDALPRQQTLRALIDWSFDLLDARERTVFRRLGTFVDGFALEAAVAVCADDALGEFEIFDTIASLVDKSLVVSEMRGEEQTRYRLLESTRAYAREKLLESGDLASCNERRLRHLAERAAAAHADYEATASNGALRALLATELEDVRGALDDAFGRPDAGDDVYRLLWPLARVWHEIDRSLEGADRIRRALERPIDDERLRVRLELGSAFIEQVDGRKADALALFVTAAARARRVGDRPLLAESLIGVAFVAGLQGERARSRAALTELETFDALTRAQRFLLFDVRASDRFGDVEQGLAASERLRDEARSLGNAERVHVATLNVAEIAHGLGQTARAIQEVRRVLDDAGAAAGLRRHAAINLTGYLAVAGDPEALIVGRAIVGELASLSANEEFLAVAIEHVALALASAGDAERAATLEGYVRAAFEDRRFVREQTEQKTRDALLARLRAAIDEPALAKLFAAGAHVDRAAAIALVRSFGSDDDEISERDEAGQGAGS